MSAAAPRSHVILGISADFHDASAAIVIDGALVNAAQQERFSRIKHDPAVPIDAIRWCLDDADVGLSDLTHVVVYDKPLTSYERHLASHAAAGLRSLPSLARTLGAWSKSRLWLGYRVEKALRTLGVECPEIWYSEHHLSHAAAAYYPSPFDRAVIVTIDGVGEWATTTIASGAGHRIEQLVEQRFPHSMGMFYSAFTAFWGFEVNDGEYKLMGLAPYGEPRYVDRIYDRLVELHDDGAFRLDQRYFDYQSGRSMFRSKRWSELFDGPPLPLTAPPTQREADLARSAQAVLEELVLRTVRHAHSLTGERSLCLAGGVAWNGAATARLLADGPFDEVWTQPAADDGGSSIGAAMWAAHQILDTPRHPDGTDQMRGAQLGPRYRADDITRWLDHESIAFEHPDPEALAATVAAALADGAIVGWFDGPMEFGPRALGCRSILADPRTSTSIDTINRLVKGREGFRPLAPAVLAESVNDWFESTSGSPIVEMPYMTVVARTKGWRPADPSIGGSFLDRLHAVSSPLPAVTHVDGTARVQTVGASANPTFRAVLQAFEQLTGCPVLVNTSFNRAGEPIVCTPSDAVRTAAQSGLDLLVIEGHLIERDALSRFAFNHSPEDVSAEESPVEVAS